MSLTGKQVVMVWIDDMQVSLRLIDMLAKDLQAVVDADIAEMERKFLYGDTIVTSETKVPVGLMQLFDKVMPVAPEPAMKIKGPRKRESGKWISKADRWR